MIQIRKAGERGHFDHGWLDTWHTFSFDQYYDPAYMGFRSLRVINQDRVAAGAGFPTHGHRDMEIVSYVLEGALEHRDSLGNGSVVRPGEVQRMSAGTGVQHSEFNASRTDPVRFLQIWILPRKRGLAPGYEQRSFADRMAGGSLCLVASPDGRDGSVKIHQNVQVFAAKIRPGRSVSHPVADSRAVWVHVARGSLDLNGVTLNEGDGAAAEGELDLRIATPGSAEFLLFDLV